MNVYEESQEYILYFEGGPESHYSDLKEAERDGLKLSSRKDFVGEPVYIYNRNLGRNEIVFISGKKIVERKADLDVRF